MLRRPGVYTTISAALALVVVLSIWSSARARGQVDVSVDAAMVRGAAAARVTIFEFSDYE